MRILFLLSCLEPAGSETYCTTLAEAWRGKHDVHWISDRLHYNQPYTSMPIHGKAVPFGLINTMRVAFFIRKHRIQIVHSHSRRANWVAAQAAAIARVPHVATVHQSLPLHFFSKSFPCLGDETIAIDEVVADHLRREYKRDSNSIHLIRNAINLVSSAPSVRPVPKIKQILMIGRLSGGRWHAFEFFLDVLQRAASTLPPAHYKIIGQVPLAKRADFDRIIRLTSAKINPSTIEALGFVKDLGLTIRNADGVIAAGRSALESLAQGRPVIFLGEGGVIGLRKPESWSTALRTNLGDHLEPKSFVPAKLEVALRELLTPGANEQELNAWARAQVEREYDMRKIAGQVEAVYARALKS